MISQKFGSKTAVLLALNISMAGVLILSTSSACAALGGDSNSVISDRLAMAVDNTSAIVTKTARSTASSSAITGTAAASGTAASSSASATAVTYTVQTMTTAAGTTVNEYLNASGAVFAVSWSGPFIPDLRQLLGEQYFATYNGALAERAASGGVLAGRRHTAVQDNDLIVQSTGRMRAFRGVAYLQSLLPVGFTAADIQ